MNLPKNEKSFLLNETGEITGRKYEGTFTIKCALSIGDKRILEIEKSTLTADLNNPTNNLDAIGTIIANLRVRTIDAPDWFKQSIRTLDLLDEDIYITLYSKCLELSEEWLNEVRGKSLGEQKAEKAVAPQQS